MKDCNNCKHKMCWEYAEPCSSCTNMTGEPTNWEPQSNADVKPVVRGEWIEHGEPNQCGEYEPWYWKCSICGAIACHDEYNFCPNCGADMRMTND